MNVNVDFNANMRPLVVPQARPSKILTLKKEKRIFI